MKLPKHIQPTSAWIDNDKSLFVKAIVEGIEIKACIGIVGNTRPDGSVLTLEALKSLLAETREDIKKRTRK